jgi:hypothetical protein
MTNEPETGSGAALVPLSGPIGPVVAVEQAALARSEGSAGRVRRLGERIATAAERILLRRLYVADEIASNPLEDARDRLRALEFLAAAPSKVADPRQSGRGKVLVVKVATRATPGSESLVEVRAEAQG